MFDLIFGIGLNAVVAGDALDYKEPMTLHVKVQHESFPVYAWGSVGKGKYAVLGQGMAESISPSVGLGVSRALTPRISVFAEAGVTFNDLKNNQVIVQETAFTYLVGRHAVHETRPIPVTVTGPYDQDSYATTYEVDDPFVVKLGAEIKISSRWSTSIAYRHSKAETLIEIYDEESRDSGGGWWMEKASTDLSAVELQILFRW